MANTVDTEHVEIRLVSKDKRYSVADIPYSVPSAIDCKQLNALVKSIIKGDQNGDAIKHVEFDFLISTELLRVPLIKHVEEKNLTTEGVTEVEYIVKQAAPEVDDSLPHDDWVSCIHSNDRWLLSGCYDNNVYMWDLTNHKHVHTISEHHQQPLKSLVIIPNSPGSDSDVAIQFASGSHDQTIRIFTIHYDSQQAQYRTTCTHVCRGHANSVDTLACHPRATYLASGSFDTTIKLWNVTESTHSDPEAVDEGSGAGVGQTGSRSKRHKSEHVGRAVVTKLPKLTLPAHREPVSSVTWASEDQLVSASWDHTIRMWDMNTGREEQLLQGSKSFLCISYSQCHKLVISGSVDRHVRLWDPREGNILVKGVYTSHSGWVSDVQWANTEAHTNHNLFISASYDNVTKLWDVRCPKVPLYDMSGHDEKVLCCDWANPSYIISGGADSKVKMFALGNDKKLITNGK